MLQDDSAFFSRDPQGRLQISFDDGVFVRADVIFIDPSSREVSALLDGIQINLGTVSEDMAITFMEEDMVVLTAPHPLGHDLKLTAPILAMH